MMLETVIGLEVHVELNTEHKLFCSCKNRFGDPLNTNRCEICEGLPGAIPVFNKEALIPSVKTALILGCGVEESSGFDRKNYFYPDLPKGYQITQFYRPFAKGGKVYLPKAGKTIRIREVHMEDDAAKIVREGDKTTVDYNRCGVPLNEIVTMPDFRSGEEVTEFLEILRKDLKASGVTDGKMEQGSMRVDVNISVHDEGEEFGTRTEIKNLSSFKATYKAIEAERKRQEEIISAGGLIFQQTLRFDEDNETVKVMRDKENSDDYKYFPEPDLDDVIITEDFISEVRADIPELPSVRSERFVSEYRIREEDAVILCGDDKLADVFEKGAKKTGDPSVCSNLLVSFTGETGKVPDAEVLIAVSGLLIEGKISSGMARTLLKELFENGRDPYEYIREKDFLMITDDRAIEEAVLQVLGEEENKKAVSDYLQGKDKVLGFLVGKVMKKLKGRADPGKTRKILTDNLVRRD